MSDDSYWGRLQLLYPDLIGGFRFASLPWNIQRIARQDAPPREEQIALLRWLERLNVLSQKQRVRALVEDVKELLMEQGLASVPTVEEGETFSSWVQRYPRALGFLHDDLICSARHHAYAWRSSSAAFGNRSWLRTFLALYQLKYRDYESVGWVELFVRNPTLLTDGAVFFERSISLGLNPNWGTAWSIACDWPESDVVMMSINRATRLEKLLKSLNDAVVMWAYTNPDSLISASKNTVLSVPISFDEISRFIRWSELPVFSDDSMRGAVVSHQDQVFPVLSWDQNKCLFGPTTGIFPKRSMQRYWITSRDRAFFPVKATT